MKESTESANVPGIVPQGAIFPDVFPVRNAQTRLSLAATGTAELDTDARYISFTVTAMTIEKLNACSVTSYIRLPRVCPEVILRNRQGSHAQRTQPRSRKRVNSLK